MAQTPEEIVKEVLELNSELIGHGEFRDGAYKIPYHLMDHCAKMIVTHLKKEGFIYGSKGLADADFPGNEGTGIPTSG